MPDFPFPLIFIPLRQIFVIGSFLFQSSLHLFLSPEIKNETEDRGAQNQKPKNQNTHRHSHSHRLAEIDRWSVARALAKPFAPSATKISNLSLKISKPFPSAAMSSTSYGQSLSLSLSISLWIENRKFKSVWNWCFCFETLVYNSGSSIVRARRNAVAPCASKAVPRAMSIASTFSRLGIATIRSSLRMWKTKIPVNCVVKFRDWRSRSRGLARF